MHASDWNGLGVRSLLGIAELQRAVITLARQCLEIGVIFQSIDKIVASLNRQSRNRSRRIYFIHGGATYGMPIALEQVWSKCGDQRVLRRLFAE